jgi:hypothetical protein
MHHEQQWKASMGRFHISQDETGYFQLAYENDAGQLTLVSYQSDNPDQLVEDATKLADSGEFGPATVVVDPSRRVLPESAVDIGDQRPAPRKAGQ